MPSADGGDDTARPSAPRGSGRAGRASAECASACLNFDTQSVSRKRKTTVVSRDSNNLVSSKGTEDLVLVCEDEDSLRISMEIENLRSELEEDVKELGYCEENEKLRAELALKAKEIQCLRKQNEELQAENKSLHKNLTNRLSISMAPSGQGEKIGGRSETSGRCCVDDGAGAGKNLGAKALISRKRKAAAMCTDSNSLAGIGEGKQYQLSMYKEQKKEAQAKYVEPDDGSLPAHVVKDVSETGFDDVDLDSKIGDLMANARKYKSSARERATKNNRNNNENVSK